MAGKPAVQVQGAKELRAALTKMGRGLDDLKAINLDSARIVASEAKGRAPRRSGTLAGDIRATATQRSGSVAAGRKRVPYAGVIHFGWPRHNIRPQPFLFSALDARRQEVADKYAAKVEDLVNRLDAETPG